MTDPVSEFLVTHRTTAKWLDDIIDVLLDQPRGTAHVGVLADKLWRSEKRDVASIEQTITRSINNFCSDAADFNKTPAHDLFQRVEPGTYRLRSFPEKPNNIYELTAIRLTIGLCSTCGNCSRQHISKCLPSKGRQPLTAENLSVSSNGCLIRISSNCTRAKRISIETSKAAFHFECQRQTS